MTADAFFNSLPPVGYLDAAGSINPFKAVVSTVAPPTDVTRCDACRIHHGDHGSESEDHES